MEGRLEWRREGLRCVVLHSRGRVGVGLLVIIPI